MVEGKSPKTPNNTEALVFPSSAAASVVGAAAKASCVGDSAKLASSAAEAAACFSSNFLTKGTVLKSLSVVRPPFIDNWTILSSRPSTKRPTAVLP